MEISYKGESEKRVGKLTAKQVMILYNARSKKPEHKKLFDGGYDFVEIEVDWESEVKLTFKTDGKPGFLIKYFALDYVNSVCNNWINHPILNRSGLASLIWDDLTSNNLRRRLEQRVQYMTFSEDEKQKIILETEKFMNQIKKSMAV